MCMDSVPALSIINYLPATKISTKNSFKKIGSGVHPSIRLALMVMKSKFVQVDVEDDCILGLDNGVQTD